MANRVVIGAFDDTYVLRVSRPGFNVLSTGLTPKQLAFDSRWPEAGNAFLSGSFSINNTQAVVIDYGVTLSPAPIVLLRIAISATEYMVVSNQASYLYAEPEYQLFVGSTSFSFVKGTGETAFGTKTVYYTVYRNLYG